MSAPVTEAHQNLAGAVWSSVEYHKTSHAAQLIADSEARATAELKKRADHWCDMHTVCAKEANQLRAEVERLRECCDQTSMLCGKFITEDDGSDLIPNSARIANALARLEARAERAEAELADIRALANRRNKRDHAQDTTHQLVAALDQALDIAQAELDATKSTLDEEVNCAEKAEHEVLRQYARAERAEREVADLKANNRFHRGHSAGYAEAKADCESQLHALRLVCGTTDADKFSTWVDRAIARAEKAEAELAQFRELDAERARMRQIAVDKRIRTPTPQTDEEAGSLIDAEEVVPADFARTLERELAAERARLDWLEGNAGDIPKYNSRSLIWFTNQNLRAAIDAAMKEETK